MPISKDTFNKGVRSAELERDIVAYLDRHPGQAFTLEEIGSGTECVDRERVRVFAFWDLARYLGDAGFQDIHCYPDWNPKPLKKPKRRNWSLLDESSRGSACRLSGNW